MIDWKKEWDLTKRIWRWWFFTGLITIPFGIIYAFTVHALGHESNLAMAVVLAGAVVCNFLIQGMPPNE